MLSREDEVVHFLSFNAKATSGRLTKLLLSMEEKKSVLDRFYIKVVGSKHSEYYDFWYLSIGNDRDFHFKIDTLNPFLVMAGLFEYLGDFRGRNRMLGQFSKLVNKEHILVEELTSRSV